MRKKDGQLVPCKKKATWRAGLGLRAHRDDTERAYLIDHAVVCNHCRCDLALANFMSMRMFVYVTRQATARGWPSPRKNLTRLVFEHLKTGEVSAVG